MSDLGEAGYLQAGDRLTFPRPRLDEMHHATVLENGAVEVDGHPASNSLSNAARVATGGASVDGWTAWTVDRLNDELLSDTRARFLTEVQNAEAATD